MKIISTSTSSLSLCRKSLRKLETVSYVMCPQTTICLKNIHNSNYSKTCLKPPLKRRPKIGFQDRLSFKAGQKYCRMLQREHSAILLTGNKLTSIFKTFVLSFFECSLKTGFTVHVYSTFFQKKAIFAKLFFCLTKFRLF